MAINYKDLIPRVLDKLTNQSHMAIGSAYGITAMLFHLITGRDLGTNFVTFSAAFFTFLAGHAAVYQKWPDTTAQPATAPQSSIKKAAEVFPPPLG